MIIFGCQFNKSDSEKIEAVLKSLNFSKASALAEADLIIVLACSVRQSAIDRIFGLKQKFEQIRRNRPLTTVLSGCILKSDLPKMKEIFDIVFDIKDLFNLPKLLKKDKKQKLVASDYFKIQPIYQSKFQAYVPIMTGCNNFCSYCVVPYTRGREVSRKAKDIIKECRNLVAKGFKEITLAGQNVNSYKDGKINFPKLLKMVDCIVGEYWLSFATSHPKDMSNELIKTMASSKHLMPYLHLPAQSGDDQILLAMNRHYTAANYKNLIEKTRKLMPEISISTDIIVGFPKETKKQFLNTAKLFREVEFDMAYIAQYSPRAGTASAKLLDNVSKEEKKSREIILTEILKKTALKKNKKMIGRNIKVLVEKYKGGYCFGKTFNFKNIKFQSEIDYTGEILTVKVSGCYEWGLSGQLPKVIVVLGTTASGKTKLAVNLAKNFNGEIISADSRQVYKGMDIGTGKDLADYGKIPYHLIDVADPKSQFTVAEWQKQAFVAIDDILKRDKLPIICGGTGLYISALIEGYTLLEMAVDAKAIRRKLGKLSLNQLLCRLKKIDCRTYDLIDKNNRRRVQRALEIYYGSGIPKSAQKNNQKPPYEFLQIGITYPKDILHQRIDKRLEQRIFKEGMIEEVKNLRKKGVSLKRLDEFGLEYRFVSKYLQKKISKENLLADLSRAIKNFSKRQMTWFKKNESIIWKNNYTEIKQITTKFLEGK